MVRVLRSKNAGPFTITYDVLFDGPESFEAAIRSNAFVPDRLGEVLKRDPKDLRVVVFPAARAIKIAVPRLYSSGSFEDTDVFGCQQHAPLLDFEVPIAAAAAPK